MDAIKPQHFAALLRVCVDTECYTIGGSVWRRVAAYFFWGDWMSYRSPQEWAGLRKAALKMLARGALPKTVARELGVGATTVRAWRRRAQQDPVGMALGGGRFLGEQERERMVSLWKWGIAHAMLPKVLDGNIGAAKLLMSLMEGELNGEQVEAGHVGGETLEPMRLPWQADDPASFEGDDSV